VDKCIFMDEIGSATRRACYPTGLLILTFGSLWEGQMATKTRELWKPIAGFEKKLPHFDMGEG